MNDNFWYLFCAYSFIWLAVATYLGVLMAKQQALRRRIDDLRGKLGMDRGGDAGGR
ncbi:MAG: CcmD family protein [Acidobacteria bacterium]|nr:CcmD family protein [Acidobacteriota bacterium]